jgi:hypothetical protein
MADVPVEIGTEHLPNTNPERYRYAVSLAQFFKFRGKC